jgi:hypothetical protein
MNQKIRELIQVDLRELWAIEHLAKEIGLGNR